ncbi:DUF4232 domain-containing protein [Saccharopolyspora sp. NFXS83]|uniref:DUF4232 domain-containing protein n=1 Tax=Saccharopolyspora sp. NFXS83 TaxID=2993560 RepID=UPI00224A9D16|nr:DUF4232 domain-containing protein [Saccharopolyspora sp. NFXS83]MCX2734076.1 DUF4232 domain-containing protein [Saccharopolyspora sp. NFXS83]
MLKRSFTTAAIALCAGALLTTGVGQAAATGPGNPAPRDVSASNCSGEDFAVTLRAQTEPGSFLLELRNTSDQSCLLGGWVHLTPVTAKGTPIEVPTDYVEIPTPPVGDQRLEPGATAYSGVRAEYGDTDFTAVGFDATPADMTGKSPTAVEGAGEPYPRLQIKDLRVGTLQPTPENVLS